MADERLRLEQRAAASGDPEAVAAHLRSRVRAGDLPANMLELAAFLGHPPSRLTLVGEVPDPPEPDPILVAGVHALGSHNRGYCSSRPTASELNTARDGIPTCRRCLGSARWRDHQRTAVTRWTELIITNYGLQSGRRVAIATVRAVVAWCQDQQRSIMPSIPFDLFAGQVGAPGANLETIEDELLRLQQSLGQAQAPDDPEKEAKRIVRIVDGATLMGWSDLRDKIRDAVVPWALGLEPGSEQPRP